MKSDSRANLRKRAPIPTSECGMAMAAELLGERWALLVLRELFYGVSCYEDMRVDLSIPPATLKKRLAALEKAAIVERVKYQAPNDRPRDGYGLTKSGRELALTCLALRQWGDKWLKQGPSVSELLDTSTGKPLRVALVNQEGYEAIPERAALVPLKGEHNG